MIINLKQNKDYLALHIIVHSKNLILHKRTKISQSLFGFENYVNVLYDFKDYLKLVGDVKKHESNENIINSVLQYLKDNCLEVAVLMHDEKKVENNNNQLSLF